MFEGREGLLFFSVLVAAGMLAVLCLMAWAGM